MLMLKNHALKLGLLATAVFGVSLAACSDDDGPSARSKKYALTNGTATTGEVLFTENADSSFNVKVTLNKSTKDTTYFFNIIKGSIGTPTTDTLLKFTAFKSTATGSVVTASKTNINKIVLPGQTAETKFTYDSVLKYRSFAIISFKKASGADSVSAKGNLYQPQ
ncbi:hypothetical protein MKQ68_21175 [Chitinophaga horti]|uniref:CHRD domain-containing protein n=1 Tax=Chitinophaga horti TaxID=2920382 RepID=A0ABY6J348_9BACT|nr:hypothetical protein [Chitinophaga horti]UYQ92597.1 hypothetical protein MKQ68_21175 [Chitinophaga horti]